MSRRGQVLESVTARGLPRFEIQVWHDELNKYQVVKGDDLHVVTQMAHAKMRQWDEIWARKMNADNGRIQRAQKAQRKEEKLQYAVAQSELAQAALSRLEHLLAHTLLVNDAVDWNSLKDLAPYPVQKPKSPEPPLKPEPYQEPIKPLRQAYRPKIGIIDKLFSSRRAEKERKAKSQYEHDMKEWEQSKLRAIREYNEKVRAYNARIQKWQEEDKRALSKWENDRQRYLRHQNETNAAIEHKRSQYYSKDAEAVAEYCNLVLSRSEYPDFFPQSFEVAFNPENEILIVDYDLPSVADLPTLKEIKYVLSRDEYQEKHIPAAEQNRLYDSIIYQIALRTMHELYEADLANALTGVVFNGYVNTLDRATGQAIHPCILSLQTTKNEFCNLNLAAIDPKVCFKKLKGVGSSKLHSIAPVAPLLRIDRDDNRFVDARSVVEDISEVDNLAAMDWEDFEHLIRELFEKEFTSSGGEVKVTRASRDGGVDAVAFDPDPIRGGKIVIQAKRYTNTVGVSAVRDLYGTVMNEGANKGILVTTSDYGPDAYSFAKDKPLTLVNGGQLLHLLQKHGHRATINIAEARRLFQSAQSQ
jgi:restriction system protein